MRWHSVIDEHVVFLAIGEKVYTVCAIWVCVFCLNNLRHNRLFDLCLAEKIANAGEVTKLYVQLYEASYA